MLEYAGIYRHFTFGRHYGGAQRGDGLYNWLGFTLYLVENSGNYGRSGHQLTVLSHMADLPDIRFRNFRTTIREYVA
ncbi:MULTISPECIES: hypothetical protein [Thalassospira]|uniref:Uncharacterized protein n=1 Tax=Thalassospira povalilytica TaxID=732237 RepID=A0A8I1M8K0_9PROT|nr:MULTISPECIES: hypothetical protein [Thalassospira]MBN8197368.1 hypothetical protein [Thalassospira povalilytica]MBO6771029.1 hypothetical protein [Thalassospira sp.]